MWFHLLGDVTEVLDFWFQTPIPLVLGKEGVLVEEPSSYQQWFHTEMNLWNSPRIESTHMVVTFHASVHDCGVSLFPNTFSCNFVVHPVRITPHGRIDLAKLDRRTCVIGDGMFETIAEVAIIQKHVRIMEPSVEMSFYRFERLYDTFQFFVPCQHYEGAVDAWFYRLEFWVDTSSMKDFVVHFADTSRSEMILVCIGHDEECGLLDGRRRPRRYEDATRTRWMLNHQD